MNRRKISHLALVLVLVCSVWLPAAIDISKARIGAVTDEQVVEIFETNEGQLEGEENSIIGENSEKIPIELLDQFLSLEDEVNYVSTYSSSRGIVTVYDGAGFIEAWNNEEISEIRLNNSISISSDLLIERTSDLAISSNHRSLSFFGADGGAPKWKNSTLTVLNTGLTIGGILDVPEGDLHFTSSSDAITDQFAINGAGDFLAGDIRIRNFVLETGEFERNNIYMPATFFVTRPITILENLTIERGSIESTVRSVNNGFGAKASVTVLGTTMLYENIRVTNDPSGLLTNGDFPVLSTSRLVRPVDAPLAIWTSKPNNLNNFFSEPDNNWLNANFIMENSAIVESSNNTITDENFQLSKIWQIDNTTSDLWTPPALDEIELTIKYVNENGGEEISHTDISFHAIGSRVEVDDRAKDLFEGGYDFSKVSIDPEDTEFDFTTNRITIPNEKVIVTFYYKRAQGEVSINYQDMNGLEIRPPDKIEGDVFSQYEVNHPDIFGYAFHGLADDSAPVDGVFQREVQNITFIYTVGEPEIVPPVDPLNPDIEVNPDNKPEIPEDQGNLSIDFVSQFNFGQVNIGIGNQQYNALSQRLLNEDGLINENEERPNFVQISDRRETLERSGWVLSATVSDNGFVNSHNEKLKGAQIVLRNQQLATSKTNGSEEPIISQESEVILQPGVRNILLHANHETGSGTWIYRFGNLETAATSIQLDVPNGANPKATNYNATLYWELSVIPGN